MISLGFAAHVGRIIGRYYAYFVGMHFWIIHPYLLSKLAILVNFINITFLGYCFNSLVTTPCIYLIIIANKSGYRYKSMFFNNVIFMNFVGELKKKFKYLRIKKSRKYRFDTIKINVIAVSNKNVSSDRCNNLFYIVLQA